EGYIPTFAPAAKRRAKIQDVRANDAVVWPDFGHIPVIDSIDPVPTAPDRNATRVCRVVGSTAATHLGSRPAALQNSLYAIRSVGSAKKFKIERPQGNTSTNDVYIAPLA